MFKCSRCKKATAISNGLCQWCQTAITDNLDKRWELFKDGFCLSVYDMLVPKKNSFTRGVFF